MRKSKIIASVVSVALVASVAATASISASAISKVEDIEGHKVGVTGSFCNWGNDGDADVEMTNNGGVWEATIDIPEVTEAMVVDATKDDGSGNQVSRGFKGITFKVRLDDTWDDSWGDYEPGYDRTYNSQTNCAVKAEVGTHVKINVKLDTTKNSPEALSNPDGETKEGDPVDHLIIPVTYTVEEVKDEKPAEESKKEESKAESKESEESKAAEPADTSSPATGDTTSAIALVAVVLASLGTAVVMTKKASAKD